MNIALICMPMVNLQIPSLGLTQLKSALNSTFNSHVSCEIIYLSHDFAKEIGIGLYNLILNELNSGLGDWFFRQLAFPDEPDNSEEYFKHYFVQNDERIQEFKTHVLHKRKFLHEIYEKMINKYNLAEFDLIGFTSLFHQNVASLAMARLLKEKNNNIITVMGGANVQYPMGVQIIKNSAYIDYIFSGPALRSFSDFIQYQINGEPEKCHTIKGVWTKSNFQHYLDNGHTDFFYGERVDLNLFTELDYNSFLDSYQKNLPEAKIKPYLLFATSDGCYWGEKTACTFCAQGGPSGNSMKFRSMEPENAVKLIKSLFQYSDRIEYLYAADSIVPINYHKEVFSKIKSEIPIHLEMGIHHSTEENIRLLSQAGVKIIEAGIESLSSESLHIMKKGTSSFQNLRFMMDCMMNDILVTWNFLVGAPGEHEKIYEKFYNDIPKLVHFPPGELAVITFERFSEYHNNPEKYGLKLKPYRFYSLIYPFSQESISDMAYIFHDHSSSTYKKDLIKWINKLEERCNFWKLLWNRKNKDFPLLYFTKNDKKNIVIDSRSGAIKEYAISETSYNILQTLTKPTNLENLAAVYTDVDIKKEIDMLYKKGLIFYDRDMYLSIVFPEKPPEPTFYVVG